MAVAQEEEVYEARVDVRGHLQIHASDGGLLPGRQSQRRPHLDGGARGLQGVILVFEEEEQGVAPELEHGAASPVNELEHPPEDGVEDGCQFLCADPTTGG